MAEVTFDQLRAGVLSFYNSDSDIWNRVNLGTATEAEIYAAYSRIPNIYISRSTDGTCLGYDYNSPISQLQPVTYADPTEGERLTNELNQLFSNSQPAAYSGGNSYNMQVPANFGGNSSSGYTVTSGATSGVNQLAVIADRASLAVTGVNLGTKLGMAIDSALYNLAPDWWDEHYPTINPETWDSMAETEGGKSFIRTLFGIPDSGSGTAYMDERMLAYTYQMLRDLGVFNQGEMEVQTTDGLDISPITVPFSPTTFPLYYTDAYGNPHTYTSEDAENFEVVMVIQTDSRHFTLIKASGTSSSGTESYTHDNKTVYFKRETVILSSVRSMDSPHVYPSSPVSTYKYPDIAWLSKYKSVTQPTIPGITQQPDATVPSPTVITGTTTDQVLQQLKQNYPQLFDGSITSGVLQDDGTIKDFNYVPVPWPAGQTPTDTAPTTGDATQTGTLMDDETISDILKKTPTNDPPDTGTGTSSPIVLPSGSASSLWAVYHPSQAQLNAFGAWLWSSDFVEQIKKLFTDPMQAIIGVHKVFAPIPTGASQNIKCGYLDSGVASPIVTNQYTNVNCGSVNCSEYFGNVFDYDPHTKVSIYLPFIGVVPLKVSEVMRSVISVSYGVDVITGACLAKVHISRDGCGGVLYSYGGSCACHYPISSGSYAGIISGVVTSALGIATGIASGSPLAALGGTISGIKQMRMDVQHSGGFTGCAGAMGPKKPYLIITRPQTKMAHNVENFFGKPSNATMTLGECSGYVRVKHAHVIAPGAYDDELKEIEALLLNGVMISN